MKKIIRREEQLLSTWSGGTTRQIFIYPEGSDYAKREFDFRLSTATVDCESSTFTPLPGVHRHLMILEGELEICHQGRYRKKLASLEQDEFEGDWQTLSFGKVVDFNLMLKTGKAELFPFAPDEDYPLYFGENISNFYFLYLHQGMMQLDDITVERGDLLYWDEKPSQMALRELLPCIGVTGCLR